MHRLILIISLLLIAVAGAQAAKAKPKVKVACVGDSITAGFGVQDASNVYPAQLGDLLGEGYDVQNFGTDGATMLDTGDLPYKRQESFTNAVDFAADIVIIELGTNDSKSQNWSKKQGFAASTTSLVAAFQKANAKAKIFICFPVPVVGKGNFGIRDEVVKPEVIPLLRQTAAKLKLPVIDLYTAFAGKSQLIPDGVHPNDEGAGLIAKTVFEAVTKGKKR